MTGPSDAVEILVQDGSYPEGEAPWENRQEMLRAIEEEIAELGGTSELKDANLGRGADWPFIAITIGGLFLLGKDIEENLDAWIRLGSRFLSMVQRLRSRIGRVYVDAKGALLITVGSVQERLGAPNSLEVLSQSTTNLDSISFNQPGTLAAHHDNLYVHVIIVNGDVMLVVGIRSTGEVEFIHEYHRLHGYFDWTLGSKDEPDDA
jgi:hypothetical protein